VGREGSQIPTGRCTACFHARFRWMRVYYVLAALLDPRFTCSNIHSSCHLQIDAQHCNYPVCQSLRTPVCAISGSVFSVVNSSARMHGRLARIDAFSAVSLASMLNERCSSPHTCIRAVSPAFHSEEFSDMEMCHKCHLTQSACVSYLCSSVVTRL